MKKYQPVKVCVQNVTSTDKSTRAQASRALREYFEKNWSPMRLFGRYLGFSKYHVVDVIAKQLRDEQEPDVRRSLRKTLAEFGDLAVVTPLKNSLLKSFDSNEQELNQCLDALQTLYQRGRKPVREEVAQVLYDVFQQKKKTDFAVNVLERLGSCGDEAFNNVKDVLLDNQLDIELRKAAAIAMKTINTPEAHDVLLGVLKNRKESEDLHGAIIPLLKGLVRNAQDDILETELHKCLRGKFSSPEHFRVAIAKILAASKSPETLEVLRVVAEGKTTGDDVAIVCEAAESSATLVAARISQNE